MDPGYLYQAHLKESHDHLNLGLWPMMIDSTATRIVYDVSCLRYFCKRRTEVAMACQTFPIHHLDFRMMRAWNSGLC